MQEHESLITPLHLACEYNSPEVVSLLLENGAGVHTVDSAGNTALHYAARCDNPEIVRMLVDHVEDSVGFLSTKNKRLCTGLQLAVEHDRHATAEYLLGKLTKSGGAHCSSATHLLHIAARKGFTRIVKLLCKVW